MSAENKMAGVGADFNQAATTASAIPLSTNIATQADAIGEYNRLLNSGYLDADIRNAANQIYGTQSDADWSYLQSQATKPTTQGISLPEDWVGRTADQKINYFNQNNIDENALLNAGVLQEDINWMKDSGYTGVAGDASITGIPLSANISKEADAVNEYNRLFNTGYSDAEIRDMASQIYGMQSDEDWSYLQSQASNQTDLTNQIFRQFANDAGEADFATLNKGFEWAQANEIDDKRLKNILGEERYNEYVDKYGKGILETLRPALEDDKISPQEALDIVTSAKSFGLDANEIAKYTGLDQRIPDAFFNTYDRVVSGIVGNALDPESTQTEKQKVGGILALQTQYGLTDKDIADYSNGKLTEDDVKNYLGGVKTFESDFQALVSKPDVTAKEVNDFIDNSRKSRAVTALYGDSINTFDQKLDDLEGKWKSSGVDALQAETVYNQLKTITDAAKGANWAGSWKGGGDGAALEATKLLVSRGVDNLSDLKVEKNFEQTPTVEMYKGVPVYMAGGKRYISTQGEFGPEYERVPDGAQTQLAAAYEDSSGEGDNYYTFTNYRPLTAQELETYDSKTGKFALESGTKLIDGSSGKIIAKGTGNNFILDSYDTGNFFKGKNKKLGIQMTDSGIPVPYQIEKKEGFVYSPALPLFASLLVPGLSGMVGGMLPGAATATTAATGLNTALSQAITGGLIGGGVSALRDGDILKGVVGGAANPLLSYGIGQLVPTNLIPGGMDTTLGRTLTNTGANVARAAFSGGDLGKAALTGITSGALDYALKPAFDALNLSPTQVNLLTGIVMPAALTGNVNPLSAISTLAGAVKSGVNK